MITEKSVGPRGSLKILDTLSMRIRFHFHGIYGKSVTALCEHQSDQPRACPNIENVSRCIVQRSPCPKQDPIRAHFHGTAVLTDSELFKFKIRGQGLRFKV